MSAPGARGPRRRPGPADRGDAAPGRLLERLARELLVGDDRLRQPAVEPDRPPGQARSRRCVPGRRRPHRPGIGQLARHRRQPPWGDDLPLAPRRKRPGARGTGRADRRAARCRAVGRPPDHRRGAAARAGCPPDRRRAALRPLEGHHGPGDTGRQGRRHRRLEGDGASHRRAPGGRGGGRGHPGPGPGGARRHRGRLAGRRATCVRRALGRRHRPGGGRRRLRRAPDSDGARSTS